MRFSHFLTIAATTLALGLSHVAAYADDAGDQTLTAAETSMNKAKTLYFEYEATTTETGKPDRRLKLNVWIKGDKRLTELTSPADITGTKVLILAPTEMYVYIPTLGKVRRIARPVSDPSAFGMAFSQEDLATQKYSDQYSAAQISTSDQETKITLTPKSGQTTLYSKIEMTVTKDHNVPSELRYYNSEGKLVKTETRSGYTRLSNVWTPDTVKMVDHTKNLTTTLVRKSVKVNESIADDVFSKRGLAKQ